MSFASDKLYNGYVRRNLPTIVSRVSAREIIPHLPCLTDHDREIIEARRETRGNRESVQLLLDCLKRREKWPEQLIEALEACEQTTLAAKIRAEYKSLRGVKIKRSCGSSALNLPPHEKLLDIRSSFIEGISGPVLKVLLDKLFEKKVMTDAERESADEKQNQRDKARFVIDTVRRKGEAASSEMIKVLCEVDPFLCEHLGLS